MPKHKRSSEPAFHERLAWPGRLLVQPAAGWQLLREWPDWRPALLAHVVLGWAALALKAQPLADVWTQIGNQPELYQGGSLWASLPIAALRATLGLNLWALLLWGVLKLINAPVRWRDSRVLLAYGLLPLALSELLGAVSFAILRPITAEPATALAWQIWPVSFGLVGCFAPLSYGWFCASFLDAFGLWSLYVLWLGLRNYTQLSGVLLRWSAGLLVLTWLLSLLALWQVAQLVLAVIR